MEQITTVGIDLAKRVFALHGVDATGRIVLRRTACREQLVEVVAVLPPCRIGMEACAGAMSGHGALRCTQACAQCLVFLLFLAAMVLDLHADTA